ncbi:MAG: hypothetical protein A2X36_05325, partial [Elusimicrobia bacterium GWA2_69_24]
MNEAAKRSLAVSLAMSLGAGSPLGALANTVSQTSAGRGSFAAPVVLSNEAPGTSWNGLGPAPLLQGNPSQPLGLPSVPLSSIRQEATLGAASVAPSASVIGALKTAPAVKAVSAAAVDPEAQTRPAAPALQTLQKTVQGVTPEQNRGQDPALNAARLDGAFDGSKVSAVSFKDAVLGGISSLRSRLSGAKVQPAAPEPYLGKSPELPLPVLDLPPSWRRMEPAAKSAGLSYEVGSSVTLGKEGEGKTAQALTVEELAVRLQPVDAAAAAKNGLVAKGFELAGSAAAGSLVSAEHMFFWLDGAGRLVKHDPATGKTKAYAVPSGPIQRFLVGGANQVYAVAGRELLKLDLAPDANQAVALLGPEVDASQAGFMLQSEEAKFSNNCFIHFPGWRLKTNYGSLTRENGTLKLSIEDREIAGVRPAGRSIYFTVEGGKTRAWRKVDVT